MKYGFLALLATLLPAAAQAKTVEFCNVQEYLGSPFDDQGRRIDGSKVTAFYMDGSQQTQSLKSTLIPGFEVTLRSGLGASGGRDGLSLQITVKDATTGAVVNSNNLFLSEKRGQLIPENFPTLRVTRANKDALWVSCGQIEK